MSEINLNDRRWLSFHIFYTNHNFLLKECIYDLVSNLESANKIELFFFIRYWEKGSHIRLRVLPRKDTPMLKDGIILMLEEFLTKYPSTRSYEKESYYPNNSVQLIEYIPEIERYGGEQGIIIAEEHFHSSSKMILKIISEKSEWNIDLAIGFALQFYIVFFQAVNFNDKKILAFTKLITSDKWRSKSKMLTQEDNVLTRYGKSIEKQLPILLDHINTLRELIKIPNHSVPIFSDFYNEIQQTITNLNRTSSYNDNAIWEYKKIRIFTSYLHMLNNRLGLRNHHEDYLSYILQNIVEM
jgi:thiopeptide-type bacteriocin biosynthesis protein